MKLIEIKNNFAKLYYLPAEDILHIGDFLTVNDENQMIVAQVISAESTNKADTNCALIKFSMNLSENGILSAYNGYIPSVQAAVTKTEIAILKKVFGPKTDSIRLGEFSANSELDLYVKKSFLNEFVYIQSDYIENTQYIFNALSKDVTPLLYIDAEGSVKLEDSQEFILCKNFKLPINFETLNYIYENDLNGLTVEQKATVQDIVLEIQDYIKSEQSGFIPFSTLLSVVDDIYKTDKSVGIILFRNKLIKYHQQNLFASNEAEFKNIFAALVTGKAVSLNLKTAADNWKKEAVNFIIRSISNDVPQDIHIFLNSVDEAIDKETAALLYQKANIKPCVSTKYSSEFAALFKSYAKNLILFAPEEHHKTYPTYSSFLSKLSKEEYIITGASTLFTPVIVVPVPEHKEAEEPEVTEVPEVLKELNNDINKNIEEIVDELEESTEQEETIEKLEEESADTDDIKNIFEETVEAEIAKDVDSMFSVNNSDEDEEDMFSDEDLDLLDDLNEETDEDEGSVEVAELEEDEATPEIIDLENITEENILQESIEELPVLEEPVEEKKAAVPNIPVYTTALDENFRTEESIKVAEGNIVYHEKYGRGVVEQIITYGKKTLCSIQFDNIGRRLLDPNLADLKQV